MYKVLVLAAQKLAQKVVALPGWTMSNEILYSVKRPNQWFWRTNVTREEVLRQLEKSRISGDWWICPLGEANRSTTVDRFLADPTVLQPEPSPVLTGNEDEPRSTDWVTSSICLLFVGLAFFNLIAIGFLEQGSPIGAIIVAAVIYAQVGLVATWGVFSSTHFTNRLRMCGGVGLVLLFCFMLGIAGPAGGSGEVGLAFTVFLLFSPLLLFAVQSPLWAARIWLQWEIAKVGQPPSGSYLQLPGIIDLIIGTTAIGVALAAMKIGPTLISEPQESQQILSVLTSAAGIAGAASLVTVTPLVFITLRPRAGATVAIGLMIWYAALVAILVTLTFATGYSDARLRQACLVGPGFFATITCATLLIVRHGGYRLFRGRRASASHQAPDSQATAKAD